MREKEEAGGGRESWWSEKAEKREGESRGEEGRIKRKEKGKRCRAEGQKNQKKK